MTQEGKGQGKLVFPGYTVKERLAGSPRAVLIRARQNALERDVLIKLVPAAAADKVEAVRAEVKLRLALHHDAVAAPIDEGSVGAHRFFVFELPEGQGLESLRAATAATVLGVARRLFRFLEHAHRAGLFLSALGTRDVRVTSAGEIRIVNLEHAVTAAHAGGHAEGVLRAPEAEGKHAAPSVRADLYVAGALLRAGLFGVSARAVGRASNVPAALRTVLRSVLAQDPGARPASSAEVLAALEDGPGAMRQSVREVLGVPGMAVLALLAVGAGIAAFWLSLAGLRDHPPAPAPRADLPGPADPAVPPAEKPVAATDPAEAQAAAAFSKGLAEDETSRDDWHARVAGWEAFTAAHAGTEWAKRANARIAEIRAAAEKDAEKRLAELIAAAGEDVAALAGRLDAFADVARNKGTKAADTALERVRVLRESCAARVKAVVARAEELARAGDFETARAQLADALKGATPEGAPQLEAARTALAAAEKRWTEETERWRAMESAARSACDARRFRDAARALAGEGGAWARPEIAAAHARWTWGCASAARAFDAVMDAVRGFASEKTDRVFKYRQDGALTEVEGRVIAVSADGARVEIKRKNRTEKVAVDPLALDIDMLCAVVKEKAPDASAEEAVASMFALAGFSAEADAAAARAGDGASAHLKDLLDAEREVHAARAVEAVVARGAALAGEGRGKDVLDLLAKALPPVARSAAVRTARPKIREMHARAFADVRRADGAGTTFRGNVSVDAQGTVAIEYTFADDAQRGDWLPLDGKGTVAAPPQGKGMDIGGSVGLLGGEPIFAGGVRVEGDAEPCSATPNVGIVLGGGADAYEVLFGLGFEQLEPVADSALHGPLNLVLLKLRGETEWRLAFKNYDEKAKVQKGRLASFAIGHTDALELTFQRRVLFRKPLKALAGDIPAMAELQAPGSIVLQAGPSTVRFYRLRVSGALRAGWLDARWAAEAARAFEAMLGPEDAPAPPAKR